jgi:flavin-dependent dehydrogenase
MWDVIVAGAGPAGAVTAHVLSRAGYRILLADRLAGKGRKIGETLPGAAVRLLRSFGLPVPDDGGPHVRVGGLLSSWNSPALTASDCLRDPYGCSWRLDRERFDADLRRAAIEAGANWRRTDVSSLQKVAGGWEVGFRDGAVAQARWIVDATGRRAALARRLKVSRVRGSALVAFYGVGRTDPDRAFDRTIMEATRAGWWYAARLPSGAPIAGFHTDASMAARLRTNPMAWQLELAQTRHIARLALPEMFDETPRALDARDARLLDFAGDGWTACGDAAMCFDPISGQGLFSALHSGQAAAMAVLGSINGDAGRSDAYSSRMSEAWTIYRARLRDVYRSELRWQTGFWQRSRLPMASEAGHRRSAQA